ncbi:MAG: pyruvate carboxylase subunit B [Vulcanimicrobiaceae bacterium]
MKFNIVDTTLRDAQQCLWATRMTTAQMLPVAPILDNAGFESIEFVGGAVFDVCVRFLQEDPWERMRILSRVVTKTPLMAIERGQSIFTFELFSDDVVELTMQRFAANGMKYVTTYDPLNDMRNIEVAVRAAHAAGLRVLVWLGYSLSPVHTDEYFVGKAHDAIRLGADVIVLKDASGLLTPDRVKTIVPALKRACGPVPVHLVTHCTTGLGPLSVLEGIRCGVDTVYTAISALAHGASEPPTEWTVRNARRMGFEVPIDLDVLPAVADHFRYVAARENKPLGKIAEYDPFYYEHQIPGGMISNMMSQLRETKLEHRLDEILEETVRVRKELGYLVMWSPLSQYVMTQAVLNVIQGERYKTIPDEVRRYVLGYYGRPAAPIDPIVLERIPGSDNPVTERAGALLPPTLRDVRRARGPFDSDDDLLLAVFYNPEYCRKLVEARPIRVDYPIRETPLLALVKELTARPDIRSAVLVRK